MHEYRVGDFIYIPSSELGKRYGKGKIVSVWFDKIAVDFSGHLGHYTLSNHPIIPATFLGMEVVLDDTIPENEFHIKFNK